MPGRGEWLDVIAGPWEITDNIPKLQRAEHL